MLTVLLRVEHPLLLKNLRFLLLILITSVSYAQYGTIEGLVLFNGEVVGEDGVTVLSDVHLLNRNNGEVVISDPSGFFSMYVAKTHVVRFTSVGYEPFYFSLPGGFKGDVYYVKIEMKQRSTPLRNVTIYGEDDVQQSMLAVPEEPNPLEGVSYGTLQGEAKPVEPGIANVASLLWDWWSREGKQKRKLQAVLKQEALRDEMGKRFESELIWELTGLYGDELERFKRYCKLPPTFVLYANEYDFLIAVKTCYYGYKSQ